MLRLRVAGSFLGTAAEDSSAFHAPPQRECQNVTMTALMTEMERSVDYVVLPVTFGLRSGTMRLADGRLSYTRRRKNRIVFDAPVSEFHSFARSSWGTGFHLLARRHPPPLCRVPPRRAGRAGTGPGGRLVEDVTQLDQSLAKSALSRAEVDRWHDALVPVIAPHVPSGIRFRPPLSSTRFLLAVLGFAVSVTLVLMAIVAAIVLAGA